MQMMGRLIRHFWVFVAVPLIVVVAYLAPWQVVAGMLVLAVIFLGRSLN